MKAKNIVLVIVIVCIVGFAGYLAGTRSKVGPSKANQTAQQRTTAGSFSAGNQPIDFDEILSELKARLAENPNDGELHARLGDVYFGMQRFDEAIGYYKKAIELNPDDVDSYNDMGLSYHYKGNTVEGLKFINEGIAKNPYYQRIWLTKGFLLAYGLGNRKEATEAWQKAVTLDPDSPVGKAANAYLEEFTKK